MGGTLTASTYTEDNDQSVDPLSVIPQAPIPEELPKIYPSTSSPLLSVQDDAESVTPQQVPSTENYLLQHDGEYDEDKPLGPDVTPNETLADIESSVDKFEGGDEAAARKAVEDAMFVNSSENSEPPQDSNTMLFAQPDKNTPPPSMPPPVVPPFPIPDDKQ